MEDEEDVEDGAGEAVGLFGEVGGEGDFGGCAGEGVADCEGFEEGGGLGCGGWGGDGDVCLEEGGGG